MKNGRVAPAAAVVLVIVATALILWQFVFKRDDSMRFSTTDLPAAMKTTTPPAQVSGIIPRRSPGAAAEEFIGSAARPGATKGPPGRR